MPENCAEEVPEGEVESIRPASTHIRWNWLLVSFCRYWSSVSSTSVERGKRGTHHQVLRRIELLDAARIEDQNLVVGENRVQAMRNCDDRAVLEALTNRFLNGTIGSKAAREVKRQQLLRRGRGRDLLD